MSDQIIYLDPGMKPVWIETVDNYATVVVNVDAEYAERVEWTEEYKAYEEEYKRKYKKREYLGDMKLPPYIWRRTGEMILKSDLLPQCQEFLKTYKNY